MRIEPHPGFQTKALSTSADIAIWGGAAGPGKSFILLMDSVRNIRIPDYGGIIFRRTTPQIRNKGALLDTSHKIYPHLGGKLRDQTIDWRFPGGTSIKFSHLQHEKDVEDHQGAQYPFIGFDELTHFSETQFWYLFGRNRSTCGVDPYMRCTCNPDADSWVRALVCEYHVDPNTGDAIPERDGVLRYFLRVGEVMIWGATKREVLDIAMGDTAFRDVLLKAEAKGVKWEALIKSFTYIHGNVYDNDTLMREDPGYLGNLLSLPASDQRRFLGGNWNASEDGLSLCEFAAVNGIFSNYATESNKRYITCDAARYGRDLMVIMVWKGWEVVKIVIRKISDVQDIVGDIERERKTWGVIKADCVVDQDGVGGDTVKLGGYTGFHGGGPAMVSLDIKTKENYKLLKDQCAYRVAQENINMGEIRISITDSNCAIFNGVKFELSTKIKLNGKLWDVRDLIKADLRAWKRIPRDNEQKLQMNPKEEQKILLGGRSPDFGDNIIMRKYCDIKPKAGNVTYRG